MERDLSTADDIADKIFEATVILSEQARRAYPLIHHSYPNVTFDQWLAFTRRWNRLPRQRGGILAIQDRRGCVHSIFSYRVDSQLLHRRMLRVSDLIVGRLPGGIIDRAIVRKAERLASKVGCHSILFELPQSGKGIIEPANRSALEKAGYVPCSISYIRRKKNCGLDTGTVPA